MGADIVVALCAGDHRVGVFAVRDNFPTALLRRFD